MLTNTPDWRTAPQWACYMAQDLNGGWWWYECRPTPSPSGGWMSSQPGSRIQRCETANPDWRQTIQSRPVAVWTYREDVQ